MEAPAGGRGARPRPARARLRRRRRRLRAQGRRQHRRRRARLRRRARVRLGAAADPQRLRRGAGPGLPRELSTGAGSGPPWSSPATPTPRPASKGCATRSGDVRAGGGGGAWLSSLPGRGRRDRRRSACRCRSSAVLAGIRRGRRGGSRPSGGASFSDAIMTTDALAQALHAACDGVTLSAQAKGAGMIEPNLATMLCFVQTDAVLEDPDAALARRGRGLLRADHGRRADEHQRHGPAAGERRLRPAAARRVAGGGAAAAGDRDRRRRRGRGPGRAASEVSEAAAAAEAERVARAIANSPLVKTALFGRDPNWGRIAQAAGMALVGEDLDEIGAERIDAAEIGGDIEEAEIGAAPRPRRAPRPRLVLRPRLRVRADQRGVHDMSVE